MLGKIVGIQDNTVFLKLNINLEEMQNIINLYVLLEDKEKKIIGEIIDLKNDVATINLVGEFIGDKFLFGVSKKPSFSASSKIISKEKIVKRKNIEMKPMDEEEAILEMELLGHAFFVYKDMDTNNVCVLYKRKDGDYGLIETK